MTRCFLRRAVAAALLAAGACLPAAVAQALETAAPAARSDAAQPQTADSLLDRAPASGEATTPADAPPPAAAPGPERTQAAAPAVPEVGFDDEPAATGASRSEKPSPRRKTVRASRDEPQTVRASEPPRPRSAAAAVRPRPARAAVVERRDAGPRAETVSEVAERPVRAKPRPAREREARGVVRRRVAAAPDPVLRPRLSGLELARRAARRHAVDAPEGVFEGPDYGERLVVVRPSRYGRIVVVEE